MLVLKGVESLPTLVLPLLAPPAYGGWVGRGPRAGALAALLSALPKLELSCDKRDMRDAQDPQKTAILPSVTLPSTFARGLPRDHHNYKSLLFLQALFEPTPFAARHSGMTLDKLCPLAPLCVLLPLPLLFACTLFCQYLGANCTPIITP